MIGKPNILSIIDRRIDLRRAGREYIGLCPFHNDRHPSFYVNESKQVFLCRACGESGDVIDFIMKLDGLSFPEATRTLGIKTCCRLSPPLTPRRKHAAEIAAAWVNKRRANFNAMLANALYYREIADGVGAYDLAETLDREVIILGSFYDALGYTRGAIEMLEAKESIETIIGSAEV